MTRGSVVSNTVSDGTAPGLHIILCQIKIALTHSYGGL